MNILLTEVASPISLVVSWRSPRPHPKFTPSDAVSLPEATGGLLHEGYIAIEDVRFSGLGIMQQDTLQ